MEKIKSSLSNMILVLVGVALIVGAILAYVNHITEEPIRAKAEQTLAEGIKKVMGSSDITVAAPEVVEEEIDGKPFSFTIHKVNNAAGQSIGSAVESAKWGLEES